MACFGFIRSAAVWISTLSSVKFAGLFAFVTETAWVFMDLVNHLSLLQQPTLSAERPQAPTSFRFVVLCLALSCFAHCARS
jgi:hypothetical protein